jgi:hypothetical protein
VLAAFWLVTQGTVMAQVSQSETILTKGLIFSQTSSAAPVQASQNAAIFEASLPGLDGPSGGLNPSASLTLPNGTTVSVAYNTAEMVFLLAATNNTPAGLNATYPPGHYTLSLKATFISAANQADLPADNFPAAPQFTNYAAAQQIDPTQDFNLLFTPFAGAASPDDSTIEIYDSTGTLILTDTPVLGGNSYTINQNTLGAGQTYTVHLRFRQLTVTDSSPFDGAVGFFSETVMNIATVQGGSTGTLPTLTDSVPSAGQTIEPSFPLVLQFSEAMNQSAISIQWNESSNGTSVPLNANTFTYTWTDPKTLACFYGGIGQPWPDGVFFSWALNPVSGASSNFSSTAGAALASGTYSGSFLTPGGPWSCAAQLNDPIEAPAFYLIKASNYVQSGQSAPVPDSNLGAQFEAFFEMPDNGGASSPPLIVVVPPTLELSSPGGLILTEAKNAPAGELEYTHTASANGAAGLDSAYPAGDYAVEMAIPNSGGNELPPIPTNSVSLSVSSGDYPPIPQLINSTVIPLNTIANGLTVGWDPWTGAAGNSYVSFQILDPSGNVVFSAPNSCSNLSLPASSDSIAIPPGALNTNVAYEIVLSFLSLSDSSQYMPGIPGAGYAALASVTRMGLLAYMSPPPIIAITAPVSGAFLPSGVVAVQVTASQPHGFLTGLELFSGANLIGSLTLGPGVSNFSGTISGSIPPGPQDLSVTATDNNGQTATASPVQIMAQSPSFVVTLSSPANGATFSPFSTIPLAAGASSPTGAITNMEFFMDGNLIASLGSSPFNFSVPQVYPGPHQFYVEAVDADGFAGTSPAVSVTVVAPAKNYMAAFPSTNGTLSFGFAGNTASGYVLEAANSLAPPVDWVPIQTKLLSSAQGIFSDANYTEFGSRYYRVSPLNASVSNAPAFSVSGLLNPLMTGSDSYDLLEGAFAAVTNSNGAVLNLTLNPGALPLDTPVTMTVCSGLQDYPFAGPMVAAVEVAPSEVDLFVPAMLVIQLPPNIATNQVAAFTYHVPNGELFLTPFSVTNVVVGGVTNPAIAISVSRLGGYGLAALTSADLNLAAQYPPSDPADSLDQATTLYLLAARSAIAHGPVKAGGPPSQEALVQQLLDQFDNIYSSMLDAEASGQVVSCQLVSWNSWLQDVEASGLQDDFSIQIAEFTQALVNIYQFAINQLILEANSQHDWNTICHLLAIDASGKLNAPIVAGAWQPGQEESLQQALDACLTFEFDFDTSLGMDLPNGLESSELTAQVTFSEGNPSLKYQLKGQAAVQWPEAEFPPLMDCGSVTASPTTPNFLLYLVSPTGAPPTKNDNCSTVYNVGGLRAVYWPGFPEEKFSTTCKGYEVDLPDYWFPEFGFLYSLDFEPFPSHGAAPNPSFDTADSWQIGGGGGNPVLATRQVTGTEPLPGSTLYENSNWTLKHTPQ